MLEPPGYLPATFRLDAWLILKEEMGICYRALQEQLTQGGNA